MERTAYIIDQSTAVTGYILNEKLNFRSNFRVAKSDRSTKRTTNFSYKNILRSYQFINNFWNKLISKPDSFGAEMNPDIFQILNEDQGSSATKMITTVITQKLQNSIKSTNLREVIANCNKIFHEDFPGDFILELNGNRMGMFLFDVCYDSNGKPNVNYKYKPEMNSFKDLTY